MSPKLSRSILLCLLIGTLLSLVGIAAAQQQPITEFVSPVNYTISTANGARARSCPATSCATVTTYRNRLVVSVIGTATGASVNGSTTWLAIRHNGAVVFVHSSLARQGGSVAAPATGNTGSTSSGSSSNTSTGSSSNTSTGLGNLAPVSTPVAGPPPFSCNCARTCGSMTCTEAYYQLNTCGCSQRDADSDGVPCESICPGG